ncbi:MAG: hypothetical protein RIC35_05625 [Marinoscillum sp.]
MAKRGIQKQYNNPLIVIPFDSRTSKIATNLKSELEKVFSANNHKVSVLTLRVEDSKLELNSTTENESRLAEEIAQGHNDIVIFFRPNEIYYVNGGLQTATYILVGTDVSSKKEVWKANYKAQGGFGPASLAKKSANIIFNKLQSDNIL